MFAKILIDGHMQYAALVYDLGVVFGMVTLASLAVFLKKNWNKAI